MIQVFGGVYLSRRSGLVRLVLGGGGGLVGLVLDRNLVRLDLGGCLVRLDLGGGGGLVKLVLGGGLTYLGVGCTVV